MAKSSLRLNTPVTWLNAFLLLHFLHTTSAHSELVGCDTFKCPIGNGGNSFCAVGEINFTAIGISSFNSTYVNNGTTPLTWTVGATAYPANVYPPQDSQYIRVSRSFFLGVPPTADLVDNDSFGACAIFLRGVFAGQSDPSQGEISACDSSLGSRCKDGLLGLANNITNSLLSSENVAGLQFCHRLARELRLQLPAACKRDRYLEPTFNSKRDRSPLLVQKDSECYPTTGGRDYNLTSEFVANDRASPEHDALRRIRTEATPLMTVFYPASQENKTSNLSSSGIDVHMTCLQVVGGNFTQATAQTPSIAPPALRQLDGWETMLMTMLLFASIVALVL
ncbi:hypothetical protein AJ80_01922 [Polytolypa hystricis UAMH7299]|uniref:Uncharacterized protein n=1 Tax=Polytolypa hystricis (strain UAMH7299) TaxID=1447883 RepID=A0A2B7YQY7_POLH7|nr:hypothetical protein AJ80_01922 [Polytolypa hystricis UAMH7299]